jgi:hypothetical protein
MAGRRPHNSRTGSFGLSAVRHNKDDSCPFQNAAKVHASEVTELKGDLAYEEPD